jgi:hypothetical protein
LFVSIAPTIISNVNETVYGIWNAAAGGNSSIVLAGNGSGNYYPGQPPMAVFDGDITSSYTAYGYCNLSTYALSCGRNTGFYVTLKYDSILLRAFRIGSGHLRAIRDPLTITLEGSNQNGTLLTLGSSWTLIYNGSTGLDIDPGRSMLGQTQMIPNNIAWYSSYRLLVITKRGDDTSVEYSEVQFLGY